MSVWCCASVFVLLLWPVVGSLDTHNPQPAPFI
jgi:hypothetical protein